MPAIEGILLQKSKVAWPRIFRENTKRKAVTDSYDLNRIAEVAREFTARPYRGENSGPGKDDRGQLDT
jgi:hypothetical protein